MTGEEKPQAEPLKEGERDRLTKLEKVAIGAAIVAVGTSIIYVGHRVIQYLERRYGNKA